MADKINELSSIVQIDSENYKVVAAKVDNSLTINVGNTKVIFDGSEAKEVDIDVGDADSAEKAKTIQVHLDNNKTADATITISAYDPDPDPEKTNIGDIWFKY